MTITDQPFPPAGKEDDSDMEMQEDEGSDSDVEDRRPLKPRLTRELPIHGTCLPEVRLT